VTKGGHYTSCLNVGPRVTRATMVSNPFKCLTLSLLILPPLILVAYFFASFPNPPEALPVYSSLASLPNTSRVWDIYPETFYNGGAYVKFPYGRVRVLVA
jgi:hypothetical protein